MLKNFIRRYSVKGLPYEPIPANKYNQQRSRFNLKPIPTQGLVYNPPASISSPTRTSKAFLPENDPRLIKLGDKYRTYTKEELEDYPIIHSYAQKAYDLTPKDVENITKLRNEDPKKWTISKIAKELNIDQKKVNVITALNKERKRQIEEELNIAKSKWSENKLKSRSDRKKRVLMWLRNEY